MRHRKLHYMLLLSLFSSFVLSFSVPHSIHLLAYLNPRNRIVNTLKLLKVDKTQIRVLVYFIIHEIVHKVRFKFVQRSQK